MHTLPSLARPYLKGVAVPPKIVVLRIHDRLEPKKHLADVLVEAIEERHLDPKTQRVLQASLRLQYEVAIPDGETHRKAHGSFAAFYSEYGNHASLTSSTRGTGAVFLNLAGLEGQRVGSYLMNRLVRWIKEFPEADVASIGLNAGQADLENKERRNRFYEQFGVAFDYRDPDRKAGRSMPMTVAMLTPVLNWAKNIEELTVDEYLRIVLGEAQQQRWEADHFRGVIAERNKEIASHEARPFRWAIGYTLRSLWERFAGPACLMGILAGFAYMIYRAVQQLVA